MHRLLILVIVIASGCSSSLSNWDPLAEPPVRPELPETADPNSPYAYYEYGVSVLEDDPERAADAFHWASRLDPTWADPLYAHRVAIFMAEPFKLEQYGRGSARGLTSPGVQGVDSLYRRALMLNPFLRRRHDVALLHRMILHSIEREPAARRTGPVNPVALRYEIDMYLRRADAETRARVAHGEGRYADAARNYREALDGEDDDAGLHADLGRVLFMLGEYEEAREHLARAVEVLRDRDEEELVRIYESKAVYEHSIGLVHEAEGDPAAARDAYARALQEDLSYFPVHIRLGELALASGDTATGLSELALAAELRPNDPGTRYLYGRLLARAGRFEEAEAEARRAIELEPLFAQPYRVLAEAVDSRGSAAAAAEHYRAFLERASRDAPGRAEAEARLSELEAAVAGARRSGGDR